MQLDSICYGVFLPPFLFTLARMPILAATMPGVTKAITPTCPKCGTNKNSGKVSCCIGGGAWFKKCGADSSKFEHTWTDGVKACKSEFTIN